MSPVRVTLRRTVGYARNAYSTALSVGAFLAAAGALFAFGLEAAEGAMTSWVAVWATSVSPVLPILAALLGMDAWSEERRTGRMDVMLSSPVSEFDMTVGKVVGLWLLLLVSTCLSFAGAFALVRLYAHACVSVSVASVVAAFAALAIQGALWCAVSVAASALFYRPAIAACVTSAVLVALPRGIWAGLMAWSPGGRTAHGEMPLDAHVADMAFGSFSVGTVLAYAILAALAVFVAVAFVQLRRLVGRGARRARIFLHAAVVLAVAFCLLLILLVTRTDTVLDLSLSGQERLSERTLGILSETRGDMTITGFLARSDARFRAISRTLRALARHSSSRGGMRITMRFVDPAWDVGEASRLVRKGVKPGSVVFSYGRRTAVLPVAEGIDERLCASTILRLTTPPQHGHVLWLCGHGEIAFDDYGAFGMSDIARELSRDGYLNGKIDLSSDDTIPTDCALIVVAGLRTDLSRAEIARLDAYLKQGGRLLVLADSNQMPGFASLLSGCGLNILPLEKDAGMATAGKRAVSDFANHPMTRPLRGTRLVFEKPVSFVPSAAVEASAGADRLRFTALAKSGADCLVACVERGAETSGDLEFRPMRIVAIGDPSIVVNARLTSRATANCDFFLNAVAHLSGTDAMTAGGAVGDILTLGMDRVERRRFVLAGVVVFPLIVTLVMALVALRRRHRS